MSHCMTFFQRLEHSILSGKKTATIRDKFDSHYAVGQVLDVRTHEDSRKICQIEILSIEPVKFSELNRTHAKAEICRLCVFLSGSFVKFIRQKKT